MRSVLIVPACEKGRGGGHLKRSLYLLQKLHQQAFLWINDAIKDDVFRRFPDFNLEGISAILSRKEELNSRNWKFIVLDNFRTSPEEFAFWSGYAPLVGIDEGGPCRNNFDFLIDLLPSLSKHKPNLSAPWLLPLPKNRRPLAESKVRPRRILISFGAEDPAGLGIAAARALAAQKTAEQELTLITPNAEKINKAELPGVKIIDRVPDLKERLAEYDLFFTHFGLAAFEAIYARVPVLLISPTTYHEKLAKKTGFCTIKITKKKGQRITQINANEYKIKISDNSWKLVDKIAKRYGLEEDQKEDIADFIGSFDIHSFRACPTCNSGRKKVITRFPESTFCRCCHCGIIFQGRLNAPPIEYTNDYFFDSYKKQYGKTYLEDFPNLKVMAHRRLKQIQALLDNSSRGDAKTRRKEKVELDKASSLCAFAPLRDEITQITLLDIGCAYGPFLAAASEAGFAPAGIDPCEEAVRYVNEELKLSCWRGTFPSALPSAENNPDSYDVITLWYVIEHFKEPDKALQEINRLLKKGGVLAFSTPSFSGISGRKSLCTFVKASPSDHWTIWSPRSCKKILQLYGFRLRKIVITGHHPERFPFFGRFVSPDKKGLSYRLLFLISRIFRLGDTFEVYASKL